MKKRNVILVVVLAIVGVFLALAYKKYQKEIKKSKETPLGI
jgi:Tfp pilus assembly protein PilE